LILATRSISSFLFKQKSEDMVRLIAIHLGAIQVIYVIPEGPHKTSSAP
jgi:hypothetical protein